MITGNILSTNLKYKKKSKNDKINTCGISIIAPSQPKVPPEFAASIKK